MYPSSIGTNINMETEIELKFFITADFAPILRRKIAETKVLQQSRHQLNNTYFDTNDNWLREHDIGLRIRHCDDLYIQTVKTSGRVVAGLHQRPEYNATHTCNTPQLSLHSDDIWPDGRSVEQLQNELAALFSTNFIREQWLVCMPDNSQIEVAFDHGTIIAGELQEPLCEVELELKSGNVESLFTLARQLCEQGGMRLGNLSKAARGYRLASNYQGSDVYTLSFVDTQSSDTVEACFIRALEHALEHWHYHEQIYFERESLSALHQISYAITYIRQILTTYDTIIPYRANAILHQELQWLEDDLSWLKSSDYLENLLEDKGHVLRKLDAQKWLIAELKQFQEQLPTREELLSLFNCSRYTCLLLDLSRWVLARGWQPFLNEQAQSKMQENVRAFSVEQLDRTWGELVELFPTDRMLSKQEYIDKQSQLMRNLYTGITFAGLYDRELRNRFRLSWVDLLQGIDDLLMLKPLELLLEQLDGEENEQLQRWLNRQENSILYAMEQTRQVSVEVQPYWLV